MSGLSKYLAQRKLGSFSPDFFLGMSQAVRQSFWRSVPLFASAMNQQQLVRSDPFLVLATIYCCLFHISDLILYHVPYLLFSPYIFSIINLFQILNDSTKDILMPLFKWKVDIFSILQYSFADTFAKIYFYHDLGKKSKLCKTFNQLHYFRNFSLRYLSSPAEICRNISP